MEPIAPIDGENDLTLREALVNRLKKQGVIRSQQVEEAFLAVPRHLFVPEVNSEMAYSDAYVVTKWQNEQAISSSSQPSVMAMMLEMLDLSPGQRVLEIGAGTGYNAALIAHIVGESGQVVTIDLDDDIVEDTRKHLQTAGIKNVQVGCRDGGLGWIEAAPYDRVVLTVGSFTIAPAWYEQLRAGGRLLLPLHLTAFLTEVVMMPDQWLLALDKMDGYLESVTIRPCLFMPLRGTFAASPAHSLTFGLDSGITCTSTNGIDIDMAYAALDSIPQHEETGVYVAFHEITGLRLWLALHEPHFCELYVKGEQVQKSRIPSLTGRLGSPIATVGLYERATWCLLGIASIVTFTTQGSDPLRPFNVTICTFGRENMLAQRLKEQVKAWVQAGRPFVWSHTGTMEHLQVRVYPLATEHQPREAETLITRGESQIVFSRR